MNNFTICLIVFTFFLSSLDSNPWSNVMVEAGRVIFGKKDCWRYDCHYGSCDHAPTGCECPSPFQALFGIRNCR
uniref:Putative secreted salivary protein n=1 Tax=Rhipicephalus pulchellus TaxID=72859 RepID=L7M1N9_RHIPC